MERKGNGKISRRSWGRSGANYVAILPSTLTTALLGHNQKKTGKFYHVCDIFWVLVRKCGQKLAPRISRLEIDDGSVRLWVNTGPKGGFLLLLSLHTEEVSKTLPGLTGLHTQGLEQPVRHYLFVLQVKGLLGSWFFLEF